MTEKLIRGEPDLADCLRRIASEAMALHAVGSRTTKPYAMSIAALAARAYDLHESSRPADSIASDKVASGDDRPPGRKDQEMKQFILVGTTHSAEVAWWWSNEKLHDFSYHIEVWDAVDAKIRDVCGRFDVQHDTRYCCQWEGRQLVGKDRETVELAAHEVASTLSRFKDAISLTEASGEQELKRERQTS